MRFAPSPQRPERGRQNPRWRRLAMAAAGVGAVATFLPWTTVALQSLWGTHLGPRGWQTSAGFTCLCTSLLVAVMLLAESGTPSSRQAVRPASLLLATVAAACMLGALWAGPGMLRGVSAAWTLSFYAGCAGMLLLTFACLRRNEDRRAG